MAAKGFAALRGKMQEMKAAKQKAAAPKRPKGTLGKIGKAMREQQASHTTADKRGTGGGPVFSEFRRAMRQF